MSIWLTCYLIHQQPNHPLPLCSQLKDLKTFLTRWREVTEREFPEFVDQIPDPSEINIDKLDGGSVMTDTCNSASATNHQLASQEINGVVYSLFCHNHLRNVWVKNVLFSLNDFMRGHLHDSLDEIAEELRVSPSFLTFARAIDKEFSLCANYPKGDGAIFQGWMKEKHAGELLLHVERAASGGRMDVASMAALAIYWNRNYYVEFLDEMKTYSEKDDNILRNNLHSMLISVEMVSVARLWSILHIAIVMPMRYLAANVHKWAAIEWGTFIIQKMIVNCLNCLTICFFRCYLSRSCTG